MPRHQRFERIARTQVVKSTVPRYNLSAMIVKGGRIVARGVNRMSRDRSVHAEVAALSQMIRRKANPEGAEIHVYRFLADGSYGLAKPCQECQKALLEAGIKRVWYSNDDNQMKVFTLNAEN
mgnify:CR=1 FL=1